MYQLTANQRKQLQIVADKHQLSLVLLHGSQVSGQTHTKSDIDIAVVPKKKTKIDILKLYSDLSTLFSDQIDITDLTHPDPLLLMAVMNKAILLYGSKQEFSKLQLKAFNRYQDYKPYLEKAYQLTIQKLRHNYGTT